MNRIFGAVVTILWTSAACSLVVGVDDECQVASDCTGFATCDSGLCIPLPTIGPCGVNGECETGQVCSEDDRCVILPRESVFDDIAVNTTWTPDRVYVLEDVIYVRPNVVLTVQAGTQVVGGVPEAALIVDNGRLDVRGARDAPVVFTSAQPVGTRAPGDWGGIALVGDAPVNATDEASRTLEGIERVPPLVYGGDDIDHNCGTLRYLRIEFAGFTLSVNNELNGLTLAGCGRNTLVDFVQVHKGSDDGIELFGGEANVSHAVITDPADDGLDWDQGWQGKAQFVVIRQSDEDKNGIEADNNVDGGDLLPRSSPVIFNLTIIGTNDPRHPLGGSNEASIGATLRRGTAGRIANAIFTNQGSFPIVISGADSQECAVAATAPLRGTDCAKNAVESTELSLEGLLVHQTTSRILEPAYPVDEDLPELAGGFRHETWTSSITEAGLMEMAIGVGNLIQDPFGGGGRVRFDPVPTTLADVDLQPIPPPSDGNEEFFNAEAVFLGAVPVEDDWTEGWTAYPEN